MEKGRGMRYWLLKSEPDEFGWSDLMAQGESEWTGIRNYQARNNLRAMAVGDLAFFYHSNIGKEIVGIAQITKTAGPDSSTDDPRWDSVWLRPLRAIRPVSLDQCKAMPSLSEMALVKSPRLSVQPVTQAEWDIICTLGSA
jgi:predicted RNA-binding protein with PUA-like domain